MRFRPVERNSVRVRKGIPLVPKKVFESDEKRWMERCYWVEIYLRITDLPNKGTWEAIDWISESSYNAFNRLLASYHRRYDYIQPSDILSETIMPVDMQPYFTGTMSAYRSYHVSNFGNIIQDNPPDGSRPSSPPPQRPARVSERRPAPPSGSRPPAPPAPPPVPRTSSLQTGTVDLDLLNKDKSKKPTKSNIVKSAKASPFTLKGKVR